MGKLFPFLTTMISGELAIAIANLKREAVFLSVIAVFGVIAVIFGLVAADIALAGAVGALDAALIIAGSAVAICLLVFIVMKIVVARARRRARIRREAAAGYATAAAAFLPFLLRSKATLAVGIPLAALAGYLLFPGRSKSDDD